MRRDRRMEIDARTTCGMDIYADDRLGILLQYRKNGELVVMSLTHDGRARVKVDGKPVFDSGEVGK